MVHGQMSQGLRGMLRQKSQRIWQPAGLRSTLPLWGSSGPPSFVPHLRFPWVYVHLIKEDPHVITISNILPLENPFVLNKAPPSCSQGFSPSFPPPGIPAGLLQGPTGWVNPCVSFACNLILSMKPLSHYKHSHFEQFYLTFLSRHHEILLSTTRYFFCSSCPPALIPLQKVYLRHSTEIFCQTRPTVPWPLAHPFFWDTRCRVQHPPLQSCPSQRSSHPDAALF